MGQHSLRQNRDPPEVLPAMGTGTGGAGQRGRQDGAGSPSHGHPRQRDPWFSSRGCPSSFPPRLQASRALIPGCRARPLHLLGTYGHSPGRQELGLKAQNPWGLVWPRAAAEQGNVRARFSGPACAGAAGTLPLGWGGPHLPIHLCSGGTSAAGPCGDTQSHCPSRPGHPRGVSTPFPVTPVTDL